MTWLLPTIALVKRDLITTLRLRRTYFVLLATALGACVWFWATIPRANANQFGNVAVLNMQLFAGAVLFLSLGVAFTVPAFAGTSIVSERRRDTYDLLLSSPISLFQIIVAKVASALVIVALLVLGLLPITAVPLFSIGINTTAIMEVLVILGTASFAAATGSVWISTRATGPVPALVGSYALTALLSGVPQIMVLGMTNELFFEYAIPNDVVQFVLMFSPPVALISAVIGEFPSSFASTTWFVTGVSSVTQFVVGLFFALFALISLHRRREPLLPRSNRRKSWRLAQQKSVRRTPILCPIADRFPIFWKDVRYEIFGSRRTILLVLLTFAIIGGLWMVGLRQYSHYSFSRYLITSGIFAMLGLPLLIPMFVGGIFTKDKEEQNLDAILMLPTGYNRIAREKIGAAYLVSIALFGIITIIVSPVLWRFAGYSAPLLIIFLALGAIATSLILTTACTLLASAFANSQAAAVVYAYIISAVFMGGHALVLAFILIAFRVRGSWNSFWGDFVSALSPISVFIQATNKLIDGQLATGDVWHATIWSAALVVHLLLAGFLTRAATRFFLYRIRLG